MTTERTDIDDVEQKVKRDLSECARITGIIAMPDPIPGAASTLADSGKHGGFNTIARDTLLFALEAIVQSSDAFPPLKSAASGLFFFATYVDVSGHAFYNACWRYAIDILKAGLRQQEADTRHLQAHR